MSGPRRRRRQDNHPIARDSATVIEDEPPHEFYANLLGIKETTKQSKNGTTRTLFTTQPSSSAPPPPHPPQHVIALDDKNEGDPSIADDQKSAAASVYRRAFENPPKLSALSLDETNKGFQLLSRMGFSEHDGGLGKHRQGSLEPIKTALKKDKKGLGAGRRRPTYRITHPPQFKQSHVSSAKPESKAERKRRRRREREAEAFRDKRVHLMLRTDISEEYEQLYVNLHTKKPKPT